VLINPDALKMTAGGVYCRTRPTRRPLPRSADPAHEEVAATWLGESLRTTLRTRVDEGLGGNDLSVAR